MATICPICGSENIFGALVCATCYNVLIKIPVNTQETTVPNVLNLTEIEPASTRRFVDSTMYGNNAVVMYFEHQSEPMVVHINQQAVLGRRTSEKDSPRIDLSPYGALVFGISRQHIIIRRTEKGLTAEDLDSSNGTWLNDKQLAPFVPTQLKSGDRLMLGKLSLEIFFQ